MSILYSLCFVQDYHTETAMLVEPSRIHPNLLVGGHARIGSRTISSVSGIPRRHRQLSNVAEAPGSWASSPSVRRTMQSNRKWNTKPELVLRRELHARGLRYRIHTTPDPISKCIADVVFPTERVVIFVDGCFWHGCMLHTRPPRTNSEYWGPKIQRNRERDAHVNRMLAQAGWLCIRVWEHEDPAIAALMISEAVTRRRTKTLADPR